MKKIILIILILVVSAASILVFIQMQSSKVPAGWVEPLSELDGYYYSSDFSKENFGEALDLIYPNEITVGDAFEVSYNSSGIDQQSTLETNEILTLHLNKIGGPETLWWQLLAKEEVSGSYARKLVDIYSFEIPPNTSLVNYIKDRRGDPISIRVPEDRLLLVQENELGSVELSSDTRGNKSMAIYTMSPNNPERVWAITAILYSDEDEILRRRSFNKDEEYVFTPEIKMNIFLSHIVENIIYTGF